MQRVFIGVVVFIASALSPVYASFDKAMEDYTAGHFKEAYRSFHALAAIGNYSSMFNIGVMYFRGEHVQKNPVEAWAWMQLAASHTESDSMSATAAKIFAALPEESRTTAQARLQALTEVYAAEKIQADLSPVLLADAECDVDRTPVFKKKPRYPRWELNQGRFGRVVLEYSVMPAGHVRDIEVVQSTGAEFSRAAAISGLSYRYEPLAVTEPTRGVNTAVSFSIHARPGDVNSRELATELNDWKVKAETGDPIAQYVYAQRIGVLRSFRKYMRDVDLEYQTANRWYLEAARQGVPQAQFQIGRNMVVGRGCEADRKNGLKWISAAAVAGIPEAQKFLASNAGEMPEPERRDHALRWLKNAAANGHYFSGVLLAWELVTGAVDADPEELQLAQDMMDAEPENYFDEVRILETKAAVAAANGEFKKALQLQQQALDSAKDLEWDLRDLKHRLEAYTGGDRWRGPYYYDIALE